MALFTSSRQSTRSVTPEEIKHTKAINHLADSIVVQMKNLGLSPDDSEQLQHLIEQKVGASIKTVWS